MSDSGKNREEKRRENFAAKQSKTKKKNLIIAIGVLVGIAAIIGWSAYVFIESSSIQSAPGGPKGAGALGSDHQHASLLVRVFGDKFDFSVPAYQIKSPWIHFEGSDGNTIHRHATGVPLGYLFDSLKIHVTDKCFVFPDGREFCSSDQYSLKFYINHNKVDDITKYIINEGDRILISYGGETQEELDNQLLELDNQKIIE